MYTNNPYKENQEQFSKRSVLNICRSWQKNGVCYSSECEPFSIFNFCNLFSILTLSSVLFFFVPEIKGIYEHPQSTNFFFQNYGFVPIALNQMHWQVPQRQTPKESPPKQQRKSQAVILPPEDEYSPKKVTEDIHDDPAVMAAGNLSPEQVRGLMEVEEKSAGTQHIQPQMSFSLRSKQTTSQAAHARKEKKILVIKNSPDKSKQKKIIVVKTHKKEEKN